MTTMVNEIISSYIQNISNERLPFCLYLLQLNLGIIKKDCGRRTQKSYGFYKQKNKEPQINTYITLLYINGYMIRLSVVRYLLCLTFGLQRYFLCVKARAVEGPCSVLCIVFYTYLPLCLPYACMYNIET